MSVYDLFLQGCSKEMSTSGSVAATAATASFAAAADTMNYISGYSITGGGATAAGLVTFTITGLLGGTQTMIVAVPAGATLGITPIVVQFDEPIQASARNVAITASLPSLGSGNTNAAVNISGYRKKYVA
jgi:hypothetical protein